MAASKLKTDWVCIGSSGKTIDGREISPEVLHSMAENYDPQYFAAFIWPDHDRWFSPNFGKVDSLKAQTNEDGSVSLMAILSPNENYIFANRQGQYLHSSMEITYNFPEPGKQYLSGLACTDDPASARTSEVRFSRNDSVALVYADSVSLNVAPDSQTPDEKPGWFARHFKRPKQEPNMADKTTLEQLKATVESFGADIAALRQQFSQSPPATPSGEPVGTVDATRFSALEAKLAEMEARFSALQQAPTVPKDQFDALDAKFTKLQADFSAALSEAAPGGTPAGTATGAGATAIVTDC